MSSGRSLLLPALSKALWHPLRHYALAAATRHNEHPLLAAPEGPSSGWNLNDAKAQWYPKMSNDIQGCLCDASWLKECLTTHDVSRRPHLNFSEATGLFQTNLSQLGTICLQTRNTKIHHTYWILQHSECSARPKECNLQPFTKSGGNKQIETGLADQQTWPLCAAFWWWQAILPAVHFVAEIQKPSPSCASDPTQRFGLPDHRVFVPGVRMLPIPGSLHESNETFATVP